MCYQLKDHRFSRIGSKSRWSLPHPSEEMPDILVFGKPTVSIMDHPHSSATNKLLTVNEDHDNEGNESDVSKSPVMEVFV